MQDSSHNVHLAAAVAEPQEEMQAVDEEAALHLDENLIDHKRSHDAQRTKLVLGEDARVHALWREHLHVTLRFISPASCFFAFSFQIFKSIRM